MKSRTKPSHRVLAIFFTVTFLQTLIPYNQLWANNNGPTAPEASSFEPIDATDMVNLATGDLSYVLPLLNVPSPEGGYPLSLAYHAGIAMDQEASWTGLGWTVNPGAINRSVNGYPDDWDRGTFKDYYYNKGTTYVDYSASISFSSGGGSVGLNLAWGDSRSFGGSVNFGVGLSEFASAGVSVGTSGASLNGGVGIGKGMGISGSIGTNGVSLGINSNLTGKNSPAGSTSGQNLGIGISSSWSGDVSANVSYSQGEIGKKNSIGLNFSSSGVGVSGKIAGRGIGLNTYSFSQSISNSDYNVKQSGWNIPVFIPLPGGILSFSFGKQKTVVSLDKLQDNIVNGSLYFKNDFVLDVTESRWENRGPLGIPIKAEMNSISDTYEVAVNNNVTSFNISENNAALPGYDNYRVTGQGIAGSMVPRHRKNGALQGLDKVVKGRYQDFKVSYELPSLQSSYVNATYFKSMPVFQFENDYTTSFLQTPKGFSSNSPNTSSIFSYMTSTNEQTITRKRGSRFVEYFTNSQLAAGNGFSSGLLKPLFTANYDYASDFEPDGIGAFKITAPDGKTYHYTMPVYNHEIVARQFGMDPQYTNEVDAFQEKRQLKKYATHWLLTAITGPDFVDMNNDQKPDKGDYGYWVAFDYGKWTNGYIWYGPHGKDYEESGSEDRVKSYSWGRKDIYYLDKVITRTHTALFVKEERGDSKGKQLSYVHRKNKVTGTRTFNLKEQSLLRLKEVILIKNTDLGSLTKSNKTALSSKPIANSNYNIDWFEHVDDGGGRKLIRNSSQNLVLDAKDDNDWIAIKEKSLKTVDFTYDYSLATGAPYSDTNGRLTLKGVKFMGKGGISHQPPYTFNYITAPYTIDDTDAWGYDKFTPQQWSLTDITMPTGGKIQVEYEPDTFGSAINQNISFSTNRIDNTTFSVSSPVDFSNFGIGLDDQVPVVHRKVLSCTDRASASDPAYYQYESFDGLATVIEIIDSKRVKLKLNGTPQIVNGVSYGSDCFSISNSNTYTRINMPTEVFSSSIRVKSLATTDGVSTYRTEYNYNLPGSNNTSGVVSFIPFAPFADKEVPYGMELPPPIPMYGNVRTTSYGSNNTSLGYTDYEFKTLPLKEVNSITFGDIIQMGVTKEEFTNITANAKVAISNIEIKDNTACLGQLLSTATYNNQGHMLTKTINNYAAIDNAPKGVARESYQYYKKIDYTNDAIPDEWYINATTKTSYSSSLKSTTVIQDGFSSTTYFDQYDPNSGQLLVTTTKQSDGKEVRTETIPAYSIYNFMGSKIDNLSYKNMLTQDAMSKTYIKNNNTWNIIGAGISTWSPHNYTNSGNNTTTVWRKHKSYGWDGTSNNQGVFTSYTGDFDGFNWNLNATSQPSDWKLLSQINQYDPYSMILEVQDINDNKASTKMGDDDTKIMATANAGYNEMFYSGAEYMDGSTLDQGISAVGRTSERAHTGSHAIKITNEQGFKTTISGHRAGEYKISVWVSKDNYTRARIYDGISLKAFNGEIVPAGDWVLMNHYTNLSSSNKTIYVTSSSGTTFFDDFRMHPIESSMKSYVYNEWDELSFILEANNLATQFVYDQAGQLCSTYSEVTDQGSVTGGFKLISKNRLQYKNGTPSSCSNIDGTIAATSSTASVNCSTDFDVQTSGSIASWSINFGDGNSQNGTFNPPANISHEYTSAGSNTITLTVTDNLGNTQSSTTAITVVTAYYFNNIRPQGVSTKRATLNGTPGQPIIFGASAGGSSSDIRGSATVNGTSVNLQSGNQSVGGVSAGVFPSSGKVECYLNVSSSSGAFGNASLRIEKAGDCGTVSISVSTR